MIHLSDEQLIRLAEVADEHFIYNEHELEQMEHLKTCTYCYEKFCSVRTLLEVTSDSGYSVLSEIYGIKYAGVNSVQEENRILAVINIARNKLMESIDGVLEQINRTKASFCFEPVLAAATRGNSENNSCIYKVEDIDDDKTFVVFDSKNDELFIQINTKGLMIKKIAVYLQRESGTKIEIPLQSTGKIYKGTLKNLPTEKMQIVIEKEE